MVKGGKQMNQFRTISNDELMDVNGGSLTGWAIAGLIILGCCIFGVGVYNGYNDTMDQK